MLIMIMIIRVIIQHWNIDGMGIYNKNNHLSRSGSLHLIKRQCTRLVVHSLTFRVARKVITTC